MTPTSAWHMADWRRKSRQCSEEGRVNQCQDDGGNGKGFTVVQTVHLLLSGSNVVEVVVLVHVLVQAFLEES